MASMWKLLVLCLALSACEDSDSLFKNDSDGGGGPPGGGGTFPPGGVTFPWPVFDGTVPDTPESSTGKTWYCDPVHGDDQADGTSFASAKRTLNAVLTGTS